MVYVPHLLIYYRPECPRLVYLGNYRLFYLRENIRSFYFDLIVKLRIPVVKIRMKVKLKIFKKIW